jgi:hypothetical protein
VARRPIFLANRDSGAFVRKQDVEFEWHPGLSVQQKRRSVDSLHEAAAELGIAPVLEISSKSRSEIGRSLSAFNLSFDAGDAGRLTVEAAFQGSKVFERGGPYRDMYGLSGRQIKRDGRLKNSGALVGFDFEGDAWGLQPQTAFYDWLYVNALSRRPDLATAVLDYAGFSDIEFNPKKSINCQARSVNVRRPVRKTSTRIRTLGQGHFRGVVGSRRRPGHTLLRIRERKWPSRSTRGLGLERSSRHSRLSTHY